MAIFSTKLIVFTDFSNICTEKCLNIESHWGPKLFWSHWLSLYRKYKKIVLFKTKQKKVSHTGFQQNEGD